MGWDVDIKKLVEKQKGTLDQATRSVNLALLDAVLDQVPVDRGETKNAIVTSIGSPRVENIEGETNSNQAIVSREQLTIDQSAGTEFYITVTKPWVNLLEFGGYGTGPGATNKTTRDGFSIQAPSGFLRVSVLNVRNGIKEIINS